MSRPLFAYALLTFFAAIVTAALYYLWRARRASRTTWMTLLSRLKQVDRDQFAAVALDLLEQESGPQLDPDLIFNMIGGMEGLDAVEQNCDVLIDLASYVQRWYPEALEIAEELRLNSREIQWHIGRLRGAARTGHMYEQFPIYAQRAVATYYLMTRSLLILYKEGQVPGFAELQSAL